MCKRHPPAAATNDAVVDDALDSALILKDPNSFSQLCANMLDPHVTKHLMLMTDEKRNYFFFSRKNNRMIEIAASAVNSTADTNERRKCICIEKWI